MKKLRQVILTLFMILNLDIYAQTNLVPNPSFEDTVGCPDGPGQLYKAVGWYDCTTSPEYMNSCGSMGGTL